MSQEWNPQGEQESNLPKKTETDWSAGSEQKPTPTGQPERPFSTFRAQPPTPPPAPPPANPKPNYTWIYLLIIALLLGGCIYLFLDRGKRITHETELVHERDTIVVSRDHLQEEYNGALSRLDELTSKNAQLKTEVDGKDGEIANMKKQINAILSKEHKSEADILKAQKLIGQLKTKVVSYEERIAKLEGENKELTTENSTVKSENSGLQEKVKLGSVLHASNIRLTAIDLRRHGTKQKETEKARKADLLRIQFDIDENRIAEAGSKEIYIAITGPDGTLLSNAAFGSGSTTKNDGGALNYTMVKQVSLQENQSVKDIVVDWNQDSEYLKGDYSIELYHEGFKIGSGSVHLR